jgi:hypothetical protein
MAVSMRRLTVWSVLLATALGTAVLCPIVLSAQDLPKEGTQAAPQPAKAEEVRPAPMTPKERVGLYVFLGWLWLSIGFLLFFLRQKVREADRVFRTGLYGIPGGVKEPPKT